MSKKKEEIFILKNEYILLALDPSFKQTGWSIIRVSNKKNNSNTLFEDKYIEILDYGIIPNKSGEHIGKILLNIENNVLNIIKKYNPDYCTLEESFVSNNRKTAQRLSQVHGVLLLILARFNIKETYYSVMTAKSQTLNGVKLKKDDGTRKTGEEMKIEVANKIIEIFNANFLKNEPLDITDSLSIGITFIKLNGQNIKKK